MAAAAKAIEKAIDDIDQAALGHQLDPNDPIASMKEYLADAISGVLSTATAAEASAVIGAIVGAIGAETGPVDIALASGAAALTFLAFAELPIDQVSQELADVIVNAMVTVAENAPTS